MKGKLLILRTFDSIY